MTELSAQGLRVSLPTGWEGRVFRRPAAAEVGASAADGPPAPEGATTNSVLHVATIALPPGVGDFASGAVESLGPDDALVVVFEYDREAVQQPLFADSGLPRELRPADFSPSVLQRALRGQAGVQRFFHEADRAFCLYVVLGSFQNRARVVPEVNRVLATIEIDSGTAAAPDPAPAPSSTPADSISAVIRARPDLSTFVALLDETDVATTLERAVAVTVFAPVDAAFGPDVVDELRADPARLRSVLLGHVVEERLPVDVLSTRRSLLTLAGTQLDVAAGTAGLSVGGYGLLAPIDATNGIVHPLLGVLEVPR